METETQLKTQSPHISAAHVLGRELIISLGKKTSRNAFLQTISRLLRQQLTCALGIVVSLQYPRFLRLRPSSSRSCCSRILLIRFFLRLSRCLFAFALSITTAIKNDAKIIIAIRITTVAKFEIPKYDGNQPSPTLSSARSGTLWVTSSPTYMLQCPTTCPFFTGALTLPYMIEPVFISFLEPSLGR